MKIGITCYPTYGGSGVMATEIGMKLASRGHQVHFISYSIPFRFRDDLFNTTFHEVELSSYPLFKYPPYDLALACKMLEVIECYDLELLHVHYAIPHAISAFLAREMSPHRKTRVITTLHGTDITIVGNDKSYFPVTRFGIEQSDGVTAVSNYLAIETKRIFAVKNPIRVIPNFVDTSRFQPSPNPALRERFAKPGEKVLLHISNFRPVKNIPSVIHTFATVAEKIPSKLLMVGDGPELVLAEELVRDLSLSSHVFFLGQQNNVEQLFQIADLFLLPSEFESFGLSALEAMSCGVPVIGANGGGLPELVVSGETGFLSKPGDTSEMGRMALEYLQNPDLQERMSRICRERARSEYEEDQIIGRYESYYQDVLSS